MEIALVLAGIVAQVIARRLIAQGRTGTWSTLGVLFAILVPLTLLTGTANVTGGLPQVAVGAAAGVVLYGATQVFLFLARAWTAFAADVQRLYRERSALPLTLEISLAALIAGGEELFWRGLVTEVLTEWLGLPLAAFVSLALFVAVNVASGSRPVIVGSLVGGFVWTMLALWPAGGLLAAVTCHIAWTTLMIAFPRHGLEGADPGVEVRQG